MRRAEAETTSMTLGAQGIEALGLVQQGLGQLLAGAQAGDLDLDVPAGRAARTERSSGGPGP